MYMCVYLNIYPDNPPASASRVLDYRGVPPRLAIVEASKKKCSDLFIDHHFSNFFSPKQKLTLQTEAEMSQISDVS